MLFVDVPLLSTSTAGLKLLAPQEMGDPPFCRVMVRSFPSVENPVFPAVNWICPALVPRVRVMAVFAVSRIPPLSVRLLLVGMPTPSLAWSTPAEILVWPL
jgi:hypothetical protein